MSRFRLPAFALILIGVSGCTSSKFVQTESSPLAAKIDSILADPRYDNAFWGGIVADLDQGGILYSRNADKSFTPASNMKLYTTAAALDQLGPEFRYYTDLFMQGNIVDSVLVGNLVVRGVGDPTIGNVTDDASDDESDMTQTFQDWADSLRAAGILRISGDILGDDNLHDDLHLGRGWMWDDEHTHDSAESGAFVFNDNSVNMTMEGTQRGQPVDLYWEPYNTDYVEVLNKTTTVHADSSADVTYGRHRATNTIEIASSIPEGASEMRRISITNPTLYFTHVLRETLIREGIDVDGSSRDIDDLTDEDWTPIYEDGSLIRIAQHESPPLSEIVAMINKPSDNLKAEQVLKTLAFVAPVDLEADHDDRRHATAELGIEAMMVTIRRAGIDSTAMRVADGSGLSHYNLVTPRGTIRLLKYMSAHPDSAVSGAFYRSLAILGVDGTIKAFAGGSPAVGNVRAKTGTLTGARALSGYVTTADGRHLVFSLMSNHHTVPTSDINDAIFPIVDLLARLHR